MKKTIYNFIFSSCLIITATLTAHTQAGSLDPTFGTGGKVITLFEGYDEQGAYSIVIQKDGKIVAAGLSGNGTDYDFTVVRYNSDGTLDLSFDADGVVTTDIGNSADYGYSVAIQSDDKIILTGSVWNGVDYDFALVRYNSDGALDTTFGTDGKVTTVVGGSNLVRASMAIQDNGKIVVTGDKWNGTDYDFTLVRYNSDGTPDTTFGTGGKVTTALGSSYDGGASVAIQSDDKIVVVGGSNNGSDLDFAVVRYNTNGTLDTSFSADGKVTTDLLNAEDAGTSVVIDSVGKIVVAGYSNSGSGIDFALVRYNSDGTLDNTFDSDGKVTTDFTGNDDYGRSMAIERDGKMVVAGISFNDTSGFDFAVIRYNSDGTLDNTFSNDGKVTTDFENHYDFGVSVTVDSDGKILVAGVYNNFKGQQGFGLVRYNTSTVGISENNAEENTLSISPNPFTNELIIQGTTEQEEIILFDLTGIELMRQTTSETETRIITKDLLPGFYVLHQTNGIKTEISKLLKL